MTDTMAMPPKVAGAIAAVMKAVPKLSKGAQNSHGNYSFASIDDFLEAVRPLCAEHGLVIVQDEDGFEIKEGWLVFTFRFTLAHISGETWGHRPARSIMVSSKMGSQAFGAAQSYALKQFERSLFQIATGEAGQDADEHPPAELPARARPTPAAPKPVSSMTADEMIAWAQTVAQGLKKLSTLEKFDEWEARSLEKLDRLSEVARDTWQILKGKMTAHRNTLIPPKAAAA